MSKYLIREGFFEGIKKRSTNTFQEKKAGNTRYLMLLVLFFTLRSITKIVPTVKGSNS